MAVDRIDRRTLLGAGMGALASVPLAAAGMNASLQPGASIEQVPLWPGPPPGMPATPVRDVIIDRSKTPGDIAWTSIGTPMLTIARPAKPNGGAVMLIPGGGYTRVGRRREPGTTARRLAELGYTAFELLYRLPHDGWAAGPDTPLQDAQRAIRVIRAGAGTRWTVDPNRIGAIGSSAGGHLAGLLATRAGRPVYRPVDDADVLSARPAAVAMCIPVVTMLDDGVHTQSRAELLGVHAADPDWQRRYSLQLDVPADSAPTWITTNMDDRSVPYRNSVMMHGALVAARVPSELHIFERGGHGAPAPRANGKPVDWLAMLLDWAGDHGLP